MCSHAFIVLHVLAEHMTRILLAEYDHIIKALASDQAARPKVLVICRCNPRGGAPNAQGRTHALKIGKGALNIGRWRNTSEGSRFRVRARRFCRRSSRVAGRTRARRANSGWRAELDACSQHETNST